MNEKKFEKKINDMTPDEKKRKDGVWSNISAESGIGEVKRKLPVKLVMGIAAVCVALCIIIPITIAGINNYGQTADGGSASYADESSGSKSSAKDPDSFRDNEIIYVSSELTMRQLAENDENILHVKEWGVNSVSLMKDAANPDRIIGITDEAFNPSNQNEITVNILYKNITVYSMDKTIRSLKNQKDIGGVAVFWSSAESGGYASFKYNGYTYLINVHGTSSGDAALSAAEALIKYGRNF